MMSGYKGHYIIFVLVGLAGTANEMARQLDPDPSPGDYETFAGHCQLSSNGAAPATHYACGVALKQVAIDQLPALKAQIPGSEYFTGLTFDEACAAMGITRIEEVI